MADGGSSNVKGDTYYGRVARNYEVRRTKQSWWHVEQEEMQTLLDKLPKALRVVDVPFGTGRFVKMYLERGHQVHGLDSSGAMIAQAGEILGADIERCTTHVGSAMELPFQDGEFDLLVSTRFLRDIIVFRDAKKALAEFARVTSKYAIIQLGQTTKPKGTQPRAEDAMGSKLTEKQIDNLLSSVGLKAVERRLVKDDPQDDSQIFHILCEKV